MRSPLLTLVISTHRRFKLLEIAVRSLCEQSADKSQFAVIIVDNDIQSNLEVVKIVKNAKEIINIQYLLERRLGLSFARNAGGKAAVTKYIGYMDDDARAPTNYIQGALELIRFKKSDIFGGPYYPYYLDPKPKWFKDEYGSGFASTQTTYLSKGQYLSGTNMIYSSSLLSEMGFFNTAYGMSGKRLAYGEETDLQVRAWEKYPDLKIYYDMNLFMEHFVPPAKMKISDRCKRHFYIGKSQAFLWAEGNNQIEILKKAPFNIFKSVFFLFSKGIIGLFFRNRDNHPYWQNYAYEQLPRYFASIGQETQRTKALLIRKKIKTETGFPSN